MPQLRSSTWILIVAGTIILIMLLIYMVFYHGHTPPGDGPGTI